MRLVALAGGLGTGLVGCAGVARARGARGVGLEGAERGGLGPPGTGRAASGISFSARFATCVDPSATVKFPPGYGRTYVTTGPGG